MSQLDNLDDCWICCDNCDKWRVLSQRSFALVKDSEQIFCSDLWQCSCDKAADDEPANTAYWSRRGGRWCNKEVELRRAAARSAGASSTSKGPPSSVSRPSSSGGAFPVDTEKSSSSTAKVPDIVTVPTGQKDRLLPQAEKERLLPAPGLTPQKAPDEVSSSIEKIPGTLGHRVADTPGTFGKTQSHIPGLKRVGDSPNTEAKRLKLQAEDETLTISGNAALLNAVGSLSELQKGAEAKLKQKRELQKKVSDMRRNTLRDRIMGKSPHLKIPYSDAFKKELNAMYSRGLSREQQRKWAGDETLKILEKFEAAAKTALSEESIIQIYNEAEDPKGPDSSINPRQKTAGRVDKLLANMREQMRPVVGDALRVLEELAPELVTFFEVHLERIFFVLGFLQREPLLEDEVTCIRCVIGCKLNALKSLIQEDDYSMNVLKPKT